MENIYSISLSYDKASVKIEANIRGDINLNSVEIELFIDGAIIATILVYNLEDNYLHADGNFVLRFSMIDKWPCFAACALSGVVGEAVECYDIIKKKSKGGDKIKDFIECMKRKGKSIAKDTAKCAIGCLAT